MEKNLLILGGSGFVSRYVVNEAIGNGYSVWYVTRGNREGIAGAQAVIADRNDLPALSDALRRLNRRFDAVIDCICFSAEQAQADLAVFPDFTDRIITISTDSLYHPAHKRVPQDENGEAYMEDDSYGGKKRQMEKIFLEECPPTLRWTLFRPPHMFGAGSQVGCFPVHTRQRDLITCLHSGKPVQLVGGGEYLIQPLYAGDLAKAAVASIHNSAAYNEIFCIAGPEAMQNREYFLTLGDLLGVPVTIEALDEDEYNANHDDGYLYFCHRVYDLTKLRNAGLPVPQITLREGLKWQIDWLLQQ